VKNRWINFCAIRMVNTTIILSLFLIFVGIAAYVRLQHMWDVSVVEFIDGFATTRCRDRLRKKVWITMFLKTKMMKTNSVHQGLVNTMVARESSYD